MSSSKRVAQKVAESGTSKNCSNDFLMSLSRNGGFCGALQRTPPQMPPGLSRRIANKENYGLGKVKVMLRVSDDIPDEQTQHFMSVDKKKRQVTLTDLSTSTVTTATSKDRGPMVAAPKIFAFDGIYTNEDKQSDVCSSALSEVIPAVLEGSDGCLLTIGYPGSGQSRTMFGNLTSNNELGAIPCAISWLYKGINDRRQKSGSRFSVRVSALGICATKSGSSSKDLLAAHATESDDSPGIYFRDGFLGGPTELRAPTAERAALFLNAALSSRAQSDTDPAIIFTMHVYQYCLSRKGGVAGGRSRLHLIDLGGCANRSDGFPLSGIGNILLAILSGQKHPPNKDHPLTPLLKDCLAPLTCHVSILAHVSYGQAHADALTTIQLASRIHRLRRRKHRFPMPAEINFGVNNAAYQSGSSEGPDPSSSDLSADTVIYMGPSDDATDGEHPPVYLPSLSSGDNRCVMSKALKGSGVEKQANSPVKKVSQQKPLSPITTNRTNSPNKRSNITNTQTLTEFNSSTSKAIPPYAVTKIVAGAIRPPNNNTKSSNLPPKGSPLRRVVQGATNSNSSIGYSESNQMHKISEEHWIDGPRLSRAKVAEARHLLREINHVKNCETWIDGPKTATNHSKHNQSKNSQSKQSKSDQQQNQQVKSFNCASFQPSNIGKPSAVQTYGYMDSHKKIMIRQWVENQSSNIFQNSDNVLNSSHKPLIDKNTYQKIADQVSNSELVKSIEDEIFASEIYNSSEKRKSISEKASNDLTENCISLKEQLHLLQENQNSSGKEDEEDQDSGPSEVPPALPLLTPLGSGEISHENLHRIISRHVSRESIRSAVSQPNPSNIGMMDCGLQVSEDEIAKAMSEHPLAALSTSDISVVSSFNIGDAFSDCAMRERSRNQFDQLAQLREIFTSQLAMAEVIPAFRMNETASVYSEPAIRFNTCGESVYSEPPYRPPSPRCGSCRQSLNISRTPSQSSLPSLKGIMLIAGMDQYASLRHPDGASDPNLQKPEKSVLVEEVNSKDTKTIDNKIKKRDVSANTTQAQLPLLQLNISDTAYDSGHDSSTPRTSKHSGISRRAESGYHSVATARDSDELSFTSASVAKEQQNSTRVTLSIKKKRQDKSLCNWLRSPFNCAHPETEGEISDF